MLHYRSKGAIPIEIPVPRDGESIETDIKIPIGSYTFEITNVRREGNTIYYEQNSHEILSKRLPYAIIPGFNWDDSLYHIYYDEYEQLLEYFGGDYEAVEKTLARNTAYANAVANRVAVVEMVTFISCYPFGNLQLTSAKMGCGEIYDFDPNAKTLTFYLDNAYITQYGDFSIEFE